MYANIQIGYSYAIQVPVADLSKVIEVLGKYPHVTHDYDGHESYWHISEKQNLPQVEIVTTKAEAFRRAKFVADEQPVVSE